MRRIFRTGVAFAALAASPALAADIPVKAPPRPAPAPVYNWTGCYVDAGGGYGMWNQESTFTFDPVVFPPGGPAGATTTSGGRGYFGTVGGGCDFQLGDRWLIGAFADYDFSDLKGDFIETPEGRFGPEKLRSSWAVGGRIGWLVTPAVLAYFSGGYTEARFSGVNLFQATSPPGDIGRHLPATTYSGWFLGGGTEIMLSPGWFVRSEYRYARYDNEFVPFLDTATGARTGFGADNEKFVQTIRTELVWKWNWRGAAAAATSAYAAQAKAPVPVKAPVAPAPVYSWSGCYLDAGGGYGMWNQDNIRHTDPALGPIVLISTTVTSGAGRGWFGTVGGGCDFQFGERWVIGAFADYDFSDLKGHFADPVSAEFGPEKLRSSWAAGGRIGWLATPAILTYFSGGFTEARFSRVDLFLPTVIPVPVDSHLRATTYSGWFLGGGTEIMLAPSWFVRSEYRYARYDNEILPFIFTPTGASTGVAVTSEKFVQTIRTELVWKWNWGGPVRAAY